MGSEQYIMVELSKSKFLIAYRVIGSQTAFTQLATLTNRGQAERLVEKLNQ